MTQESGSTLCGAQLRGVLEPGTQLPPPWAVTCPEGVTTSASPGSSCSFMDCAHTETERSNFHFPFAIH